MIASLSLGSSTVLAFLLHGPVVMSNGHDPSKAFSASVICIDTSTSISPQEFERAKDVARQYILARVRPNDLVWLIPIDGSKSTAMLFTLPTVETRLSRRQAGAVRAFEDVRAVLVRAIAALEQRASRTNLADPVELALNILGGIGGASSRRMLITSDFVNDVEGRTVSIEPPTPGNTFARTVLVQLIVAPARDRDLVALKLSPSQHFHSVREAWTKFFLGIGAKAVGVQLLSAVPVAARP